MAVPCCRYASGPGRFDGRWDDPEGRYRVLYAATDPFAAYVEVLADFRPDPAVVAGLETIEVEAATIRLRAPRQFTQNISRFVYECTDEDGRPEFHGIVYQSRHGGDLVNFATFEMPDGGAAIMSTSATAIDADDEDLRPARSPRNRGVWRARWEGFEPPAA